MYEAKAARWQQQWPERDRCVPGESRQGLRSLPGTVGSVKKVVVLDYGSGNLRSVERALARVGADVTVTADPHAALEADGLVVPGVGRLRRVHGRACGRSTGPKLIGRRLAGGRPVLGICVGMQVLFDRGVEHGYDAEGCGEWPGVVEAAAGAGAAAHGLEHRARSPAGSVLFDRHRGRALLLRALLRRARLPARPPTAPARSRRRR